MFSHEELRALGANGENGAVEFKEGGEAFWMVLGELRGHCSKVTSAEASL